ncbi:putative E3 ubiquitin-protein ligase LIN-1 [Glycine max]|nr:putative E3 ubiquitin-protein ligase LIN-1 [Glycine max]
MLDLKYMWVLVSINRFIQDTLEDEKTRNGLKLRCTSKLRIQKQEFFEFSEQSVLSNLYWGIDSIEAAIQAKQPEERTFRLRNSEQMLQVPAMLDEEEVTATIPNRYLVCCSYFYLSVVRKLQGDEWQAVLHFLQAVLVSPKLVWTEFASQLCESLFPQSSITMMQRNSSTRSLESVSSEDEMDEAIREVARRYKECLVYYQVMLYGETPWWRSYCSKQSPRDVPNTSCVSSTSIQHEPRLKSCNMRIQQESSINIMQILLHCAHQLQPDHQLLAANILLQLDILNFPDKGIFREEAVQILLRAMTSEESSEQILSTSILSNLAGTYAWTGEPYTAAWLLRKTGLTSPYHQNMIRNFNWLDQSLQDTSTDLWCSKISKCIISHGDSVFHTLERVLRSKIKRVSRDCLIAISWLGFQISKSPDSISYSASEVILSGIEQFLHPGIESEERLLACMCMFNYASGKGKQKLMHFSEGVKESLRRLSNVIWMAEELHRVADFLLPNISVWDIRGHSASLVWDIKEHKKSVTCFSLHEPSDSLLSGSTDKTIRVWKMIQRKLECVEVIALKEPIHHLRAHGETIFAISESHGLKLVNESRVTKDILKGKHVKCMTVAQGKLYIGCTDSSIQEYSTTHNRELEIKPPTRSWRKQSKPINAVVAYRDWLYSANKYVEGTTFKEWKRTKKPKVSIFTDKGDNVAAMEVVEDFLYLISSSSPNNIQIWLRGAPKKLGRISAGSKITSILAANDIIFCGTETGLIKCEDEVTS